MKKLKAILKYITFLLAGLFLITCVEEFEPETITFESALVVEATITNEMKTQEILLSRTYAFEDDGPEAETNATVQVTDDQGSRFNFVESQAGVYRSTAEFSANEGRNYTLNITTDDGRTYSTSALELPPSTGLDSIYAERIVDSNGVDGIAIYADSFDPTGTSNNYRYTYEETFRIIAPSWTPNDLVPDEDLGGCAVKVVPRETEQQTCYRTDSSTDIIQLQTNDLNEDRVSRFLIRFISNQDYIISHRYSILVRQLIQSDQSYTFYETLNQFSSIESLFSSTQPGFLNGNVSSTTDENEKVLGFFEVATVDEKRLFFNYEDFYPGEPLPPYVNPCMTSAPVLANEGGCVLVNIVRANTIRYLDDNGTPGPREGPYLVVPRVCGDCTEIGNSEVPEFWTEE
ncbi:MAG: DUF4249 domain-containing protein [Flavobacteriaceae bacterium]